MIRNRLLTTLITFLWVLYGQSQIIRPPGSEKTSDSPKTGLELRGMVLDADNQEALPYANIYVLQKQLGVISNEKGAFSISSFGLEKSDTLRFQYIGYKTKKICIGDLDSPAVIYLEEDIINLSETLIFGNTPNPLKIVKQILARKDSNYRKTTSKKQVFIRQRDQMQLEEFRLKYKKSDIPDLDRNLLKLVEEKIPKETTSYTDFLGYLYTTKNPDDSVKAKIDPIRTVSLKEKEVDDMEQIETLFEQLFSNTGEDEYWKIRSGIFSQKMDMEEGKDTVKKDTTRRNTRKTHNYALIVQSRLKYSLFDDKEEWEFLHHTGRYTYTLTGGTRVNGEEVYIIDFSPRNSGKYEGRMYVSRATYALIRADYKYAPEKTGQDIHLLGVGYTESQFSGSIYFEKKDDNYVLKYFSNRQGIRASIERNLSLVKKRKRWLFDAKLNEFAMRLNLGMNFEESIEYLVLEEAALSHEQYAAFKEANLMKVIYVDQFDDSLWSGYPIIEPTKHMKEYKKQQLD